MERHGSVSVVLGLYVRVCVCMCVHGNYRAPHGRVFVREMFMAEKDEI